MTDVGLNVWVNSNYVDPTATSGTFGTGEVDPFSNVYLDDSLKSLLGTGEGRAKIYLALSNFPTLPPPGANATITVDGKVFNLSGSQLESLEYQIRQSYGVNFMGTLEDMVAAGQMTQAQLEEATFYFLHPNIAPNSPIKELLDTAIATTTKNFFPNGTPPPGFNAQDNQGFFTSIYDKSVSLKYDSQFEAIIESKVSSGALTRAQANTLIFQHYHPSPNASLTPEEQQALANIQQEMGIPGNAAWVPTPNTALYDGKITSTYDEAFENQLISGAYDSQIASLAASTGLSKETVISFLKYQHYHPDQTLTEFTGTNATAFQSLFQAMEAKALGETQATMGIPKDFSPAPNAFMQDAFLNNAYKYAVGDKILDYWNSDAGKNLTNDDMALIAKWFANPDDPTIPDNIKAIAQSIQTDALNSIKSEYKIPGVWSPDKIGNFSFMKDPMHKAIHEIDQTLQAAFALVQGFPEPQKGVYLSFLRQVSSMLKLLKDSLYELEAVDSARSKDLQGTQLQQTLEKLDKQRESNAKQLEQRQKQEKMGIFGKIFAPIMKLVTMILTALQFLASLMSIASGPLGLAMIAASGTALAIAFGEFADACGAKLGVADKLFAAMDNAFGGKGSALATIMKVAVSIAIVIGSGGMAAMDMGPMLFEKCGLMQSIIKACGGDEQAQQLGAMITSMILGVAVAIVTAIFTGGATIAAEVIKTVTKAIEQTTEFIAKILQKLLDFMEKVSGTAEKFLKTVEKVGSAIVQIGNGVNQLGSAIIAKNLAEIKTDLDSTKEFMEAMIKMIKDVLNRFLQSLQGTADFVGDVNKTMKSNWDQMSQALTGLTQA